MREHRIEDDLSGDRRCPLFLRALIYEFLYEIERSLERHADFERLYPEEES